MGRQYGFLGPTGRHNECRGDEVPRLASPTQPKKHFLHRLAQKFLRNYYGARCKIDFVRRY
jgi:hypothetical protein